MFQHDHEDFGDPSGEGWDSDGMGAFRGLVVATLVGCGIVAISFAGYVFLWS